MSDFKDSIEKGGTNNEGIMVDKEGKERVVESNSTMIKEGDKVAGVRGVMRDITERKHNQDALRKKEKALSEAERIAKIGNYEWDINAEQLIWSQGTYRIFGVSPDEFAPSFESFIEFIHPDDVEHATTVFKRSMKNIENFCVEFRIMKRDGTVAILHDEGEVMCNEKSEAIRIFGIVRDITERKRMEEELKENEEKLRRINEELEVRVQERTGELKKANETLLAEIAERRKFEYALKENERYLAKAQRIAHVGHWQLNPKTNEVTGSDELYRIFGFSHGERTFEDFIDVVHPEDREFDIAIIRRGIEYGEDWNIEHRLICRDGTKKWIQAIGEAITDETGKTVQLVGTVQDITERKQAEEALLSEKQRVFTLLDLIPGFVYLQASDYTIPFANRRFIKQYGDPKGRRCHEIIWDRKEPCDKCPTFNVFKTKKPEMWVSDHVSTGRVYQVYDHPFIDSDGSLLVLEMSIDITERKKIERALNKQLLNLQKLSELSMTLSGDPYTIFEKLTRLIAELFDVPTVCVSEIRGEELYFVCTYVDGKVMTDAGQCSLNGTPCCNIKKLKDIRIYDQVAEKFPEALFLKEHNAVSYCGFPSLDNNNDVVAVTCLLDNKARDFSEEEKTLLRIFGQRIGMEIERHKHIKKREQYNEALFQKTEKLNSTNEELNRLAMEMKRVEEKERKRFAEVLHENIGQNLVAIKIAYESGENVSEIPFLIDETIKATRSVTSDLYPVILDKMGFSAGINWYVSALLEPNKIKVSLNIDKIVEVLDEDVKRDIFRIIRECFQNILKYSSASKVNVKFKQYKSYVRLTIKDNGIGFDFKDDETRSTSGIGLLLMRELAKTLGGKFNIMSQAGKGVKISIELPDSVLTIRRNKSKKGETK